MGAKTNKNLYSSESWLLDTVAVTLMQLILSGARFRGCHITCKHFVLSDWVQIDCFFLYVLTWVATASLSFKML